MWCCVAWAFELLSTCGILILACVLELAKALVELDAECELVLLCELIPECEADGVEKLECILDDDALDDVCGVEIWGVLVCGVLEICGAVDTCGVLDTCGVDTCGVETWGVDTWTDACDETPIAWTGVADTPVISMLTLRIVINLLNLCLNILI